MCVRERRREGEEGGGKGMEGGRERLILNRPKPRIKESLTTVDLTMQLSRMITGEWVGVWAC